MHRFVTICCVIALAAISAAGTSTGALAQSEPEAKDMELLGTDDLQGRSAYQPSIHQQKGRWIAYIGHHGGTDTDPQPLNPITGQHEFNGTSIVDVTDPRHPKYLAHIPGEEGLYESGGAQMTRVCDGKDLPKGDPDAVYLLRVFGNSAHEIWNTADPAHPVLVTRLDGLKGTHKNFWECDTGIAYLVSGAPGWRVPRMTQVYDLSDPAHPLKIRDFGLPGQQPGAEGPVPIMLHGAISTGPKSNRVYFGYGTNDRGILQIVDRDKLLNGPKELTDDNLRAPEVSRLELSPLNGAHTAFPVLEMPVAEFAKDKIGKSRNFVVVTVEKHPASVATWGASESPGDFCNRGGRFGTHSSNENMTPIYYRKLMFFAHFNAGVRTVDIRDPFHPQEVAYYIPAINKNTDKRCTKRENGAEHCAVVIQTNNVEVDDRGYIYIVDRANTGMHILELTGAARKIADFPQR
jgi:hypothetical protein